MYLTIIQIMTLMMQAFILISIIQMTAGNFKEDRKPKTGKCPYCGADVKYKKKKYNVGYNYR